MKVFHIISHFDLGGAERVAANIAKSKTKGIESHIVEMMRGKSEFTSQFIEELTTSGITCHRAWMPDARWHFVFERLAALLFPLRFLLIWWRWSPDVIHTHTEAPDMGIVLTMRLFPWICKRCKIVRTIHNNCLWSGQQRIGEACEHFFNLHDSNIAISESVRRSYFERYEHDTPIIYNGVAETAQREYGNLKKDKRNIVFAGRYERQKGIDILVEIISRMKDDKRYHFHLFGDGSMRHFVEEKLGCQQNVSLNPPLFGLSSFLASFDYMLMPSYFEGLSIVAIEASMARLPNIINSCFGLEETLPATWPLKVKDNDIDSYMTLFTDVIPSLSHAEIANEAYVYAARHFSIRQMQEAYERIYFLK